MENSENPIQWEVIHTYSRKQALEGGTLIDITDYAQLNGFKIPTAITAGLWVYIVVSPELADIGQSIAGRLKDVLFLLLMEIRKSAAAVDTDRIRFQVDFLVAPDRTETVEVLALVGPDDDLKPCLTIGLPEDF